MTLSFKVKNYKRSSCATSALDTSVVLESVLFLLYNVHSSHAEKGDRSMLIVYAQNNL